MKSSSIPLKILMLYFKQFSHYLFFYPIHLPCSRIQTLNYQAVLKLPELWGGTFVPGFLMNIEVFLVFGIYRRFNMCSQYCLHHRFFVPSSNNSAPLPFCSPIKEQLRGWSWTGASVDTDEVIHNLDYRQTLT